jgi:hypothetical protein
MPLRRPRTLLLCSLMLMLSVQGMLNLTMSPAVPSPSAPLLQAMLTMSSEPSTCAAMADTAESGRRHSLPVHASCGLCLLCAGVAALDVGALLLSRGLRSVHPLPGRERFEGFVGETPQPPPRPFLN